MYKYLLGQWRMGAVNDEWILARAPKWITQVQAEKIIAEPQDLIESHLMQNLTTE